MTDKSFVENFIFVTADMGITLRPMMGEYVVYYLGKVIGGLYDNRFLVKVTAGSTRLLRDREKELPYEGAKLMYRVSVTEDNLPELFETLYNDLPTPKRRNKK